MQVYQTDNEGFFLGVTYADPSPLEDGVWLIPAGCIEIPPPDFQVNQRARWVINKWVIEDIPPPPIPEQLSEPGPPTIEEIQSLRQSAYTREADPIAMQMLRDEATKEEWLAKIEEIKARYPYPDE
jgi:hypothetical protein